jgi:hypothetical protein
MCAIILLNVGLEYYNCLLLLFLWHNGHYLIPYSTKNTSKQMMIVHDEANTLFHIDKLWLGSCWQLTTLELGVTWENNGK